MRFFKPVALAFSCFAPSFVQAAVICEARLKADEGEAKVLWDSSEFTINSVEKLIQLDSFGGHPGADFGVQLANGSKQSYQVFFKTEEGKVSLALHSFQYEPSYQIARVKSELSKVVFDSGAALTLNSEVSLTEVPGQAANTFHIKLSCQQK